MKRNAILLLASLLLVASIGFAQPAARESTATEDEAADEAPDAAGNEEGAGAAEADESKTTPLEGDVVVFKKGTELRGVKVVRESPMFVEIEYLPGEPYLQIPATQVKEVVYAEQDTEAGQASDEGLTLGPDIMPGEEVSPEFHKMLTAAMSEEPLTFENEDYLNVIQKVCDKAGVDLSVDENLKALSKEDRAFNRTVEANTTVLDFLRKDLAEVAPDVRVILHYDRLALQKRMEESTAPEEGAAPETPAEPEPEPAPAP